MDYTVHGIFQVRILEWVAFSFSRASSQPRHRTPRSPTLQVNSLPSEPQAKPKNTGVGSLSLLQQIFLTQEWNWGLLHCRWIPYQLSYQGSPAFSNFTAMTEPQSLEGNQNPASSRCRLRPPGISSFETGVGCFRMEKSRKMFIFHCADKTDP